MNFVKNIKPKMLEELVSWKKSLIRYKYLYILLIPSIIYYIVFHYIPYYGITLAFKHYQLSKGIIGSPFAEPPLRYFELIFSNPDFWRAIRNTVILSFYRLILAFPAPIILALMLNEIRNLRFKKITQTIMYLPHFISWVVIGGMMATMLSTNGGIINELLGLFGVPARQYMTDAGVFRGLVVLSHIWKTSGWGTIIYLAALAGVDEELYAAAHIDGASRLQSIWHITLPQIRSTIVILLIINIGQLMSAGFEQIFVLYSLPVYEVGDILDTFVYRLGILRFQYSTATAAGLFKGVISLILIITANYIAKKTTESAIF